MTSSTIDPKDVQGLVRFGYSRLTEACYLLLRIRNAQAARAWCRAAPAATAEFLERPPEVVLQVAFTARGLTNLGLPSETLAGFSSEFQAGMAGDENRSRRLGDIGSNAPAEWLWGGPTHNPDVLVILCALPGKLRDWRLSVQDHQWDSAFEVLLTLDTADLNGHEPFGFVDGVSQPSIDWSGRNSGGQEQITYSNLISAGEFLLGYPNEYGKYTDRPLIDSADPLATELLPAEEAAGKKDLGRNGTFLVMRTLEQDVRGFWRFLDLQTISNSEDRRRLAEQMVGRSMTGEPLAPITKTSIAGISDDLASANNRFTFEEDAGGTRCPFGAHIRRANPRSTDYPNQPSWLLPRLLSKIGFASKGMLSDIVSSARFHRILRRGREYGPELKPMDALQSPPADDPKRGLHFVCLNANISRQFEFVQSAWLMSAKFAGLEDEADPLLGNRIPMTGGRATDHFGVPQKQGVRHCINGLPQFVTVRGGAYFFLPGIRALRYFGRLGEQSRKGTGEI